MPKQGETFINAVGVEVVAHGGSTPAAPNLEVAKANAIPPPIGIDIDVLGRQYDIRVPVFLTTGSRFVIDRLAYPHRKRRSGGQTGRWLDYGSLQKLADSKGHTWGSNELGVPPEWWQLSNPGYNDDLGAGYGPEYPFGPYGPEWGDSPTGIAPDWEQTGINDYQYTAGSQWATVQFGDIPEGVLILIRCTVTGDPAACGGILRFSEAGSGSEDLITFTGPGTYEGALRRRDGVDQPRLEAILQAPDGTTFEVYDLVMRLGESPPINNTTPRIILNASRQNIIPATYSIDPGVWWSPASDPLQPFTYQWQKAGVDIPGQTAATYTSQIAGDEFRDLTCLVTGTNNFDSTTVATQAEHMTPPIRETNQLLNGWTNPEPGAFELDGATAVANWPQFNFNTELNRRYRFVGFLERFQNDGNEQYRIRPGNNVEQDLIVGSVPGNGQSEGEWVDHEFNITDLALMRIISANQIPTSEDYRLSQVGLYFLGLTEPEDTTPRALTVASIGGTANFGYQGAGEGGGISGSLDPDNFAGVDISYMGSFGDNWFNLRTTGDVQFPAVQQIELGLYEPDGQAIPGSPRKYFWNDTQGQFQGTWPDIKQLLTDRVGQALGLTIRATDDEPGQIAPLVPENGQPFEWEIGKDDTDDSYGYLRYSYGDLQPRKFDGVEPVAIRKQFDVASLLVNTEGSLQFPNSPDVVDLWLVDRNNSEMLFEMVWNGGQYANSDIDWVAFLADHVGYTFRCAFVMRGV